MKSGAIALATMAVLMMCTGCGSQSAEPGTTSPAATKLPPLPKPAHAAAGFAIYLLTPNALAHGSAGVRPSDLEGDPFLTSDEIVSYRWATHEIELTDAAFERIRNVAIPLQGEGFAVCVDKQPIYAGAIWNAYSSSVFEGPIIDLVYPTREHPIIRISLGYPSSAFFRGDDRRSDPRILQALEEAGKLK